MARRRVTFFDILVYTAYGYFFLLGVAWFIASFTKQFNYWAFGMIVIFAAQSYFRHRLTDLILGIFAFGISVFMLLQSLEIGKDGGFNTFANLLIGMSVVSIVMAVIMMFSFTKPRHID